MNWEATAATHRGNKRRRNEDAYLCRPDVGLFAVADGMGGHAAGDVASRMAVSLLEQRLESDAALRDPRRALRSLKESIRVINDVILERATKERDKAGMGTTVTALSVLRSGSIRIAHVGDSRAYLLRNGRLLQLTTDHTWVQDQVDAGLLTPSQARRHPLASVLTRALGVDPEVQIDGIRRDIVSGDLLMLCSDGLSGMVEDEDLQQILHSDTSLETVAGRLIEAANLRGGLDNSTLVLIRVAA